MSPIGQALRRCRPSDGDRRRVRTWPADIAFRSASTCRSVHEKNSHRALRRPIWTRLPPVERRHRLPQKAPADRVRDRRCQQVLARGRSRNPPRCRPILWRLYPKRMNARPLRLVAHSIKQDGLTDAAEANHEHAIAGFPETDALDGHSDPLKQIVSSSELGSGSARSSSEGVRNWIHDGNILILSTLGKFHKLTNNTIIAGNILFLGQPCYRRQGSRNADGSASTGSRRSVRRQCSLSSMTGRPIPPRRQPCDISARRRKGKPC